MQRQRVRRPFWQVLGVREGPYSSVQGPKHAPGARAGDRGKRARRQRPVGGGESRGAVVFGNRMSSYDVDGGARPDGLLRIDGRVFTQVFRRSVVWKQRRKAGLAGNHINGN